MACNLSLLYFELHCIVKIKIQIWLCDSKKEKKVSYLPMYVSHQSISPALYKTQDYPQ